MKNKSNNNISKSCNSSSKKPLTKIVAIGNLDLIFSLELSECDMMYYNLDNNTFDKLEGLSFLSDKQELWDKISISSHSQLILMLLYINKISKVKTFIEFSSLAGIVYNDNENFLRPILTYATEHNFLFINENNILPSNKTNILFNIKKGNEIIKTFKICNQSNESITESSKNKSSDHTMYDRLNCEYSQFNFLFIDLNDFINFSEYNISLSDVLNLLSTIDRNNKDLTFIVYFPYILSQMSTIDIDSLNQLSEILSYSDIIVFDRKEAAAFFNIVSNNVQNTSLNFRSKIQFKNIEHCFKNIEFRRISKLTKNKVNQFRNGNRIGIILDEFLSISIIEVDSNISLFNNTIQTYYKASTTNSNSNTTEYKINILSRTTQSNKKLNEEYKRLIDVNYIFLKSVFYGGFFSKLLMHNSGGYELPFLIACEISKRCLDIFKLGLDFPLDPEFYYINIKKSSLIDFKEKQNNNEKNFVLDCTNVLNSKLLEYNPLFDNSLSSFFSSNVVRKHLNKQGFINTKGFLLLDVNNSLNNKSKSTLKYNKKPHLIVDRNGEKNFYSSRDKNIMLAVKENSMKTNYENVEKILRYKYKKLNDPEINKIEKLATTLYYSPDKNRKLPSYMDNGIYFKPIVNKYKLQPINLKDNNIVSNNLTNIVCSKTVVEDIGNNNNNNIVDPLNNQKDVTKNNKLNLENSNSIIDNLEMCNSKINNNNNSNVNYSNSGLTKDKEKLNSISEKRNSAEATKIIEKKQITEDNQTNNVESINNYINNSNNNNDIESNNEIKNKVNNAELDNNLNENNNINSNNNLVKDDIISKNNSNNNLVKDDIISKNNSNNNLVKDDIISKNNSYNNSNIKDDKTQNIDINESNKVLPTNNIINIEDKQKKLDESNIIEKSNYDNNSNNNSNNKELAKDINNSNIIKQQNVNESKDKNIEEN